jgi:hypothetical protein
MIAGAVRRSSSVVPGEHRGFGRHPALEDE